MREVQDHYFRLAKKEGYLSRAAYKLIEIDDRKKLLRKGDRVLDCGAAPGSWLQVASKRVGPKGLVVGIDLKPIPHRFNDPTVRIIEGDFTTFPPDDLLGTGERFDVVLSDMAPSTTGQHVIDHHLSVRLCQAVLDHCDTLLKPGGKLAMKVFEGEAYPELLARTKAMFEAAKGFKPKASRGESTEIYIVAENFKPKPSAAPSDAPPLAPAKKPAGW
ncbi:MAG TPA: RlmE family RNA methyltransferase [Phycisphaerales bacterium]|nr:RlmE family RNA methyltransferase [Phycisphaerales bacterium]HRQ74382.1 RlmE family RNA methyltransferase [Phycisphaerales bacterium]